MYKFIIVNTYALRNYPSEKYMFEYVIVEEYKNWIHRYIYITLALYNFYISMQNEIPVSARL